MARKNNRPPRGLARRDRPPPKPASTVATTPPPPPPLPPEEILHTPQVLIVRPVGQCRKCGGRALQLRGAVRGSPGHRLQNAICEGCGAGNVVKWDATTEAPGHLRK